jgi:hypothetical protein
MKVEVFAFSVMNLVLKDLVKLVLFCVFVSVQKCMMLPMSTCNCNLHKYVPFLSIAILCNVQCTPMYAIPKPCPLGQCIMYTNLCHS